MFEKFVETLNHTGRTVGEKTKQGTDVVKANIKIASDEKAIYELYYEIGKLYYSENSENPCCDTMKELFDKVGEKMNSIETLKTQLRAIKGVVVCQNCGAEVAFENDFCGKCGSKVEKPEPVFEEPATEASEEVIDHEANVEIDATINIKVDDSEDAADDTEE